MTQLSRSVAEARLAAVLDEAEATLVWAESGKGPAVMWMARLRSVLAAAGHTSMAVEVMGRFTSGAPAVSEILNDVCRAAAVELDHAIGPELAARWTIDAVADQLSPAAVASDIETGLVSVSMMEAAMVRVGALISRTLNLLIEIAEDASVLPDLREAAVDAVDLLVELDGAQGLRQGK